MELMPIYQRVIGFGFITMRKTTRRKAQPNKRLVCHDPVVLGRQHLRKTSTAGRLAPPCHNAFAQVPARAFKATTTATTAITIPSTSITENT